MNGWDIEPTTELEQYFRECCEVLLRWRGWVIDPQDFYTIETLMAREGLGHPTKTLGYREATAETPPCTGRSRT